RDSVLRVEGGLRAVGGHLRLHSAQRLRELHRWMAAGKLQRGAVIQQIDAGVQRRVFLLERGDHRVQALLDESRPVLGYPPRVNDQLARTRYNIAVGPRSDE